jgi:hypothetical protein
MLSPLKYFLDMDFDLNLAKKLNQTQTLLIFNTELH